MKLGRTRCHAVSVLELTGFGIIGGHDQFADVDNLIVNQSDTHGKSPPCGRHLDRKDLIAIINLECGQRRFCSEVKKIIILNQVADVRLSA